jgi:hypothetical protein
LWSALAGDIGEGALGLDQLSQPVGVIAFVTQHDLALLDIAEQFLGGIDIVGLPGRDGKLQWQAFIVGQSMDFRRKTAPAASQATIRVAFFKVAAE